MLSQIDLEHGLDAEQHVGGHSTPQTTRRYAQRSFAAAVRVAKQMGSRQVATLSSLAPALATTGVVPAVFNRVLADAEVVQVYGLKNGVRELYSGK